MARDWESRGDNRRYGDRGDDWRAERDWTDRAGDEAGSWFAEEDAERRRIMAERHRSERDSRHADADHWRDDRPDTRSFDRHNTFPHYDRPWPHNAPGGIDRDAYDPRRRADDRWSSGYNERNYGPAARDDRLRRDSDRGFFERAGDEVASRFGDDDAQRRREMDARHRGRGPKNYTRSDERIAEDVNDCLADDAYIDASDIEVSVSSGEVTLNGSVTERFAKRHAEDIAERISGVRHVQNNLRVADRQTTATDVTSGAARTEASLMETSPSFRH